MSLNYIYKRRLASIMYQVYNNNLPEQIVVLLGTPKDANNYNLRHAKDFSQVRYSRNFGRNSVRYRGPIEWNLIPKAIRESTSYHLFKGRLKNASRILDKIQFEEEACLIKSKEPDFLYF